MQSADARQLINTEIDAVLSASPLTGAVKDLARSEGIGLLSNSRPIRKAVEAAVATIRPHGFHRLTAYELIDAYTASVGRAASMTRIAIPAKQLFLLIEAPVAMRGHAIKIPGAGDKDRLVVRAEGYCTDLGAQSRTLRTTIERIVAGTALTSDMGSDKVASALDPVEWKLRQAMIAKSEKEAALAFLLVVSKTEQILDDWKGKWAAQLRNKLQPVLDVRELFFRQVPEATRLLGVDTNRLAPQPSESDLDLVFRLELLAQDVVVVAVKRAAASTDGLVKVRSALSSSTPDQRVVAAIETCRQLGIAIGTRDRSPFTAAPTATIASLNSEGRGLEISPPN